MASSDGTIRYHKVRSGDTLSRIAQKQVLLLMRCVN